MSNNQMTFAYVTMWAKKNLFSMLDQFDESDKKGIAASGSISINTDYIDAFAEYLKSLEPNDSGYVRADIALFFADPNKPGDLSGAIKSVYVKEETEAPKARRKLL